MHRPHLHSWSDQRTNRLQAFDRPTRGLGKATDILDIFLQLNSLARAHGIGRIDIVENRFIGVKSRGCYETPAGTILQLSKILYNGYWFSPEREFVQSALEASQKNVNGRVRLSLYKGNVIVDGRASTKAFTMLGKVVWMRWAASSPQIPAASSRSSRFVYANGVLNIKFTLKIELI
ncbi:hypothetical protein KEM48_006716 [Puccinia striiformis f. sp. tritici PST-130]|nr:hypothetical protein KEM48_006716 [Puccinia striiformis f. sp. tritici PST-130]